MPQLLLAATHPQPGVERHRAVSVLLVLARQPHGCARNDGGQGGKELEPGGRSSKNWSFKNGLRATTILGRRRPAGTIFPDERRGRFSRQDPRSAAAADDDATAADDDATAGSARGTGSVLAAGTEVVGCGEVRQLSLAGTEFRPGSLELQDGDGGGRELGLHAGHPGIAARRRAG